MSLGSEIKSLFKGTETFAEKAEAEFVKLFKASPTVLQDASNFVTFSAPLILGIETIVAPLAAPATLGVLSIIKTDLATLSAAAQSISTATTANQALDNLAATLPSLLGVGDVKDTAVVSKITGAVQVIGGELLALVPAFKAWLAGLNTPAPAAV